jgi:ATP-dependent DNA ligase
MGVASLLVASPWRGKLQYAAELACGLTDEQRAKLADRLSERVRPKPVVRCPKKARWVEPTFLCEVRYFQRMDKCERESGAR